jgi:hypothetical protein
MKARGGTVLAWSLYELGATSFAMNLLSLHLPLDIAGRVTRGSEKFSRRPDRARGGAGARAARPRLRM